MASPLTLATGGRTFLTPKLELSFQVGLPHADAGNPGTDFDDDGEVDDLGFSNVDLMTFLGWHVIDGVMIGVGAEYRHAATADFGDADFLSTFMRAIRSF